MIPLFEDYPVLGEKLPYATLADLPTPVQRLAGLEQVLGAGPMFIKRDDLSGQVYGGNKPRKLEFLLAAALRAGAGSVLTFGYAGSNHALATTVYARALGLRSLVMLLPQPNAHYVRANLLAGHHFGAELHHFPDPVRLALGTAIELLRHKLAHGAYPFVIGPGGSSQLGDTGFVNAALELQRQIASGALPEPDRIYVAAGSLGTAVGLLAGLKAAGLHCRVVAVRVVARAFADAATVLRQANSLAGYLHGLDPQFPRDSISGNDLELRHEFAGTRYAQFTRQGMEAVALMQRCEGIGLDGTYTGKALAALIADAASPGLQHQTVLFWNTYNSRDLSEAIRGLDYHQLPEPLHWYYEHDVQPLDV